MKTKTENASKNLLSLCLIAAVFAVSLLFSGFGALRQSTVAEKDVRYHGDVDNDGKTTAADARLALRACVGLEDYAPGSHSFVMSDYDKNGSISGADARMILRTAVALEPLIESDAAEEGPEISRSDADIDAAIAAVLREKYRSEVPDGLIHMQSYRLLAENTGRPDEVTVYLIVYHMTYSMMYGEPKEVAGGFVPAAVTFSVAADGAYTLKEYRTPEAGENYESDLLAIFPAAAAAQALQIEKYAAALKNDNLAQVTEYLNNLF